MPGELRKSGIDPVGDRPWGTHFCQLYETTEDLLETMVPFFAAGLSSNERCIWVNPKSLSKVEAKEGLRQALPDIDERLARGSMQLLENLEWYTIGGTFDADRVMRGWAEQLDRALALGYSGVRGIGDVAWLTSEGWDAFSSYEAELDDWMSGAPIIVLCTYPLEGLPAAAILDMARTHELIVARRLGAWEILETSELKLSKRQMRLMNEELERRVERALAAERAARTGAEATLERLRAIQTITDAALSNLSLDDLLRELLARLRITLRAEFAAVRLIDLYTRAVDGVPFERIAQIRIPLEAPEPIELEKPYMLNDLKPPPPERDDWYAKVWRAIDRPLRAGMGTPLACEGKTIGVVSVASTRTPFSDDDLELLQIVAERIGPVIARGRVVERLTAAQRRLAQLSRRLLNAQEEERRRVARELHDELGQVLTAVKINLESLQGSGTLSASDLRDAVKSVDEAVTSVHELALELRPSILDDLGLSAALRWQLDRRARQAGVVPHIQIGEIPRLPAEVETASFRVAQEALTNVLRHARAKAVWLEAGLRDGALELSVSDDGVGFDVEAARERASSGASMGLLSMEERVSLLGGSFEILSSSGRGSSVRARFPLNGGRSETAAESAR